MRSQTTAARSRGLETAPTTDGRGSAIASRNSIPRVLSEHGDRRLGGAETSPLGVARPPAHTRKIGRLAMIIESGSNPGKALEKLRWCGAQPFCCDC